MPIAALTIVSLIYGANFSIAKIPMGHEVIEPLGFIQLRTLFGAAFFGSLYFIFIREKVEFEDYKWLLICGLTGVAINQSFFFVGLNYTNPVNGALMMTCTPLIVLLLSKLVLAEPIQPIKLMGIIIGMFGAILLISEGFSGFSWATSKGDIMVLINATSFALFLIFIKKISHKYHPFTILAVAFTIGAICLIPFGSKDLLHAHWSKMESTDIWSILFVLIFTTCITYLFNTWAVNKVKPTVVSSFIYLQPLFAVIIAVSMNMDTITIRMLISGSFIFLGVYFIGKKKKVLHTQ